MTPTYETEILLCKRRIQALTALSEHFSAYALEHADSSWLLAKAGDLAVEYKDVITPEGFLKRLKEVQNENP